MDSDDDLLSPALEFFCRHLVLLSWYEGRKNAGGEYTEKPTYYGASAFVCEIHDLLWMVTAGHVFSRAKARERHGIKRSRVRVADAWSPYATDIPETSIPFDVFDEDTHKYVAESFELGVDAAFIPLPNNIGAMLEKTITPFSSQYIKSVKEVPRDDFVQHWLLGLPLCKVKQTESTYDDGIHHEISSWPRPLAIHLDEISRSDPSVEHLQSQLPQREDAAVFLAKIEKVSDVESVVGMSGGPILGFVPEGSTFRYYPVAIQSSWFEESRIIRGTLLSEVISAFEKMLLPFVREFSMLPKQTK